MPKLLPASLALILATACAASPEGSEPEPASPVPGYPGAGDNDVPLVGALMDCFYGDGDAVMPMATIEHTLEWFAGATALHVRLTLDPRFVDNTYGAGSLGWGDKGHTFKSLKGSDHSRLQLFDADGALTFDVEVDYISETGGVASGYASAGVDGGDGDVLIGDATAILDTSTSLDRNLNERGYDAFIDDSPITDASYTPDPAAPNWDYRVVYELWVDNDAFGAAGFGHPLVEFIHASPSKLDDNTIVVDPRPCPPEWEPDPECNDPDGCDRPDPPPVVD